MTENRYIDREALLLEYKKDNLTQTKIILRQINSTTIDFKKKLPLNVSGFSNQLIPLAKIIDKQTKLVFRFKESNCNTCYEKQLEYLNSLYGFLDSSNLIILASFSDYKKISIIAENNKVVFPIYNIESNAFSEFPIEQYNDPYYFAISDKQVASNFFSPDKSLPELRNSYIELVKQKLIFH